jgi:hypothetical protein
MLFADGRVDICPPVRRRIAAHFAKQRAQHPHFLVRREQRPVHVTYDRSRDVNRVVVSQRALAQSAIGSALWAFHAAAFCGRG